MERLLGASAALLMVAGVTACGGGGATDSRSSAPDQARTEATQPSGIGLKQPSVIPDDAVATSWSPAWARFNRLGEHFGGPPPNSRRFLAFVEVSNCGRKPIAYGPRVQYRSDRVLVTFFIPPQKPMNGSFACTLEAISVEKVVRLAEPIGTRDLYDGGRHRPRRVWRNPAAD